MTTIYINIYIYPVSFSCALKKNIFNILDIYLASTIVFLKVVKTCNQYYFLAKTYPEDYIVIILLQISQITKTDAVISPQAKHKIAPFKNQPPYRSLNF